MPRAMWSGSISFGLVNIPVKLYVATASTSGRGMSFHQVHKTCGTRLRHIRWCPKDQIEVPWEDVAKGYEVAKGKYVLLSDEELDALLPPEDYAYIVIENFVQRDEVDPIYFDRAYYVAPNRGATRAYALLHRVLADSGEAAVARVILRTRSHLALVRAFERHLLLETLYYEDEIVDAGDLPGVPVGKEARVDPRQHDMAMQLVRSLTVSWQPDRYHDEYALEVRKIIDQKIAGGQVVQSPMLFPAEGGEVRDIADALRRSLEGSTRRGTKQAATLANLGPVRPIARLRAPPARARKPRRTRAATSRARSSPRLAR